MWKLVISNILLLIVFSTIAISAGFADNAASGDPVCFSSTNEIGSPSIKSTHRATATVRTAPASLSDKSFGGNDDVGLAGGQIHHPYLADITRFNVMPSITDHLITKVINNYIDTNTLIDKKAPGIPILTVPQPVGIVLISSAALGLLIRFLRRRYRQLRPIVDFVIAFIGLIIALPIVFIAGLITKIISRGPVFFTQERVGKDGRLFKIIKFRTMHANAESQTGPVWAIKNDTRVTSIGRFLRKTHLDELPQLINVLKGDMSIIGPRPERPFFADKFKDEIHEYTRRLSVKPGITGLAQCYQKYDETIKDVERKLRYDFFYIKNMCWLLDMRILWKTINVSLFGVKIN